MVKDPDVLMMLFKASSGEALPVVGFSPKDFNCEFIFVFADGSTRKATLTGSNTHCSYDEDGKPRNVLINLGFK